MHHVGELNDQDNISVIFCNGVIIYVYFLIKRKIKGTKKCFHNNLDTKSGIYSFLQNGCYYFIFILIFILRI